VSRVAYPLDQNITGTMAFGSQWQVAFLAAAVRAWR
jgi:hypothetical protein